MGAQLGGEGGAIALVLMSDKALNSFLGDNTFNLDAESGLTIIDYSGASKATLGTGDVVMWSDVEGLFAGATLGANGFSFDDEANRAVYGRDVSPQDIVNGQVTASVPMGDM